MIREKVETGNLTDLVDSSADIRLADLMMRLQFQGIPGVAITENEDGRVQVYMSHDWDIQDGFENLMANCFLKLAEEDLGEEKAAGILAFTLDRIEKWFDKKNINPKDLKEDNLKEVEPKFSPEQRDAYAKKFNDLFVTMADEGYKAFVLFGTVDASQFMSNMSDDDFIENYATVLDGILKEEENLDPRNLAILVACLLGAWNDFLGDQYEAEEAAKVVGKA